MSNNDKAKEKLMESMRMTKAGSDKKIEEADTRQNKMPVEDKPVKKKQKSITAKKSANDTQKLSVDPYQAARCVWPD